MIIKIVKIYLALSLVLWAVWGHFQGGSLCLTSSVCWSLQCLISDLTRGSGGGRPVVDTFFFFFKAHLFSRAVGREGCCKQITLESAHSVPATLGLPLLTAHTAQALGCSAVNHLRLALGCMHLPGLSHSGSGTQVVLRGADSVGPAFCALPGPNSSVFGERGRCDLSPLLSLLLGFLGV